MPPTLAPSVEAHLEALVVISGPPEHSQSPQGFSFVTNPPAPGPLLRVVQEVCEMSRAWG